MHILYAPRHVRYAYLSKILTPTQTDSQTGIVLPRPIVGASKHPMSIDEPQKCTSTLTTNCQTD